MAQQQQGMKESWPELEGKSFEEAEAAIKSDRSDVEVQKLDEGSPVTRDFKPSRVRVFVNSAGNVAGIPKTG